MSARALPCRSEPSHGVDVRIFPNVSNRLAYHLQFFTPIGLRAYLRAAAAHFDVAHLHACHNVPGTIAAAALTRASVPYVVSPKWHGPPDRTPHAGQARIRGDRRKARAAAARRGCLRSRMSSASNFATLGVPRSAHRCRAEPRGGRECAPTRTRHGFAAPMMSATVAVILFLGKLTPRKGVDDLIRAFDASMLPMRSSLSPATTWAPAGRPSGW